MDGLYGWRRLEVSQASGFWFPFCWGKKWKWKCCRAPREGFLAFLGDSVDILTQSTTAKETESGGVYVEYGWGAQTRAWGKWQRSTGSWLLLAIPCICSSTPSDTNFAYSSALYKMAWCVHRTYIHILKLPLRYLQYVMEILCECYIMLFG